MAGISFTTVALCLTGAAGARAATGALTANREKMIDPHDGACFSWPKRGLDIGNKR
ncbi:MULTISPECIES: hypothetical protein [Streptomyces]|uniref:Uncharacterized protein n=1 Tax=Streptomyces ramulosus TaxID=47762 RepID=A0ABW1FRM6_9ACTN